MCPVQNLQLRELALEIWVSEGECVQNAYYTMQAMYAEDNYIHTLNEAMLRRTEPTPEEEASMMAEEDRQVPDPTDF